MTVTIENTYTGNGSTTDYSFTFPYLDTPDIKVSLAGVNTTAYSLLNATTVRFDSAPGNGVAIRIYRETAYTNPKATFYPGSAIRAGDLNDNTLQNLYVTQEANDKVANAWLTGDPTVISTESWYTTDDTKIASTKAIENRINSQIDTALTGDVVAGSSITIADNSPSSGKITISVNAATTSASGSMSAADKTKLDGIESNATADQTNAEIRAAVEAATDSNVFTDADHSKLNAIEASATADQTDAEIRAAVEAASDSNVFTDADHTKLNGIEASATADQTAAEIKTAYESNAQTNPLTDAEKAVIDGVTANTSELNKLDGVTATTANLNIVSGKTFRASGDGNLTTTSDTEIPSSKVIASHVASAVSNVGGFVTIANEVSFPTTANQPANGVIVSISDAAGTVVNGSGVSTTGRTTDGTPATVTINNFPSSLNSETLASGVALLVTSTGSSNTYNYHKILAAETDVKSLSDDINDFNARYRVASSAPGSNNDDGDLWFDTSANKMKVYNATGSSWDDVASVGQFFINTISSSSGTGGGSATFNGSAYRFTLSNPATGGAQQLLVSVNGVLQKPNSGTSQPSEGFAIDGNDIIFSAAPASGSDYFIVTQGSSVSIGTPSANSVNSSHIIDGSIVNADVSNSADIAGSKVADDSIPEAKLDVHNAPATGKYLKYTSNGMEWADGASEGTDVKSTGESGTTKFLRTDGDGTSSWQVPPSYTHPNHSGEVTSSADGAQTIASNVVDEDNLKVSNSPTNGYFLQAQSGNTGGLTWAQVQSAPTITGTMSGSIAQDKPAQIKTDGTLEAVVQTSAGVGTSANIDTGHGSDTWDQTCRTAPLGGGKFATIWINSDHYAECCITEVNPTTNAVTKGSTTVLSSGNDTNFPSVCYDHVNSRIVYSYMVDDVSGQGPTLYGKVATVSGTTQTFGTAVSIAADSYHADSCFDPENSTVVWAWEYNNHVYCNTAITTSSRSLTKGSTSVQVTGGSGAGTVAGGQQPTIKSIRLEGCVGKVGIAFRWYSDIWYKPMSVGSNSIASADTNAVEVLTALGDTDVGLGFARTQWIAGSSNTTGNFGIVTVISDGAGVMSARTFTIGSAGNIGNMYGSVLTASSGGANQKHGCKHPPFDKNLGKWIYTSRYSPASGSDYLAWQGLAPDLTASWTPTITTPTQIDDTTDAQEVCAATTQIEGTNNTGTFIDPVTTEDRIYSVWRDNADSNKINHVGFLTTNVTNLSTKVIGFADAAYTDGQTATIKVNSNTTTQSSLTPGTEYYVQGDASLGTSAHSQATVKAGIALTSTKLLIRQ